MTVTEFRPARSVFSTEAVVPQRASVADRSPADLAAELLRCSELCRLAAAMLSEDAPIVSSGNSGPVPVVATSPTPGPRWSVRPVRSSGRPAA